MDAKELAQLLDGRQMGNEINGQELLLAEQNHLVVVFGYSDDGMEVRGSLFDEFNACEGCTVFLYGNEILHNECCEGEDCPYFQKIINHKDTKKLTAIWHDEGFPCWSYETSIPHEKFNIFEGYELFCVGIVFSLDDVK